MASISLDELLDLPAAERIEIAQAIWDSIAADAERWPISDAQRAELDRRLEAYERDPNAGVSWESLKRSLEKG